MERSDDTSPSLAAAAAIAVIAGQARAADPATAATEAAQERALAAAPMSDVRDETFVSQGFLGTRADPAIKSGDGRTVWDLNAFKFLDGPAPNTVNPSLWRHAKLMARSASSK